MIIHSKSPQLDLHGIDRDYAKILVKDFIEDNYKMKEKYAVIIHGIGTGIVKKAVHEELKMNKKIKRYKQDNFNPGCTIIEIKLRQ